MAPRSVTTLGDIGNKRKKTGLQSILVGTNLSDETMGSLCVQKDTVTDCLDAHYEKWDGVHGVLVPDKKGEQKWIPGYR